MSNKLHAFALLVTILPLVSAFCGRHTHAERALADQVFDYGAAGGPLIWSNLSPDFATCSEGTRQAPTNVLSAATETVNDLLLDIPTVESNVFENLGTTVEVILNGTLTQAGKSRTLKQMHFHSPSEHRIDDEYFGAETHMVFEDESGRITVLAVLYNLEAAAETPAISNVLAEVNNIAVPGSETDLSGLDFQGFVSSFVEGADFFSLSQSLTTPPCTEGVQWFIRTEPAPLDVGLFNSLKSVVKFNARYTQNALGQQNLLARSAASEAVDFQVAAAASAEEAAVINEAEGAQTSSKSVKETSTARSASLTGQIIDPGFVELFGNAITGQRISRNKMRRMHRHRYAQ